MFFAFLQSQLCKIRSKIRVKYRVKLVRANLSIISLFGNNRFRWKAR